MFIVCFHVNAGQEAFASVEFDIDEKDGVNSRRIEILKREVETRFGNASSAVILHGVFKV
jgi:hypothetical protein